MRTAAARVPRPCKLDLKDDPSMPIWRIRGSVSLLMSLTAAGPAGGFTLDLNSQEFCAMMDLLLQEVDRLEACF